jgi:hypothetical protein
MMLTRLKAVYTGLIIIAVIIIAVSVAGCEDPNYVSPPYYSHTIKVDGMEHFYTDAGPAHIGFPAPVYNGNALLPFNDNVTLDNTTTYTGSGGTTLRVGSWVGSYQYADFHGTRMVEAANIAGRKMAVFEVVPTDYYTITLSGASTYPSNMTGVERVSSSLF